VRASRRGMFIHYEADPEAFQRCQDALRGLFTPALAPRRTPGQHQGGSSCPRRSRPARNRKS
jgi:hypothetical protein